MKDWFAVDKKGLGQLLERRGRAFAVLELISNAWDQNVTRVDVTLLPLTGKRAKYELVVVDDDPDGFQDLTHAFTLFAPSTKKAEAEKRGRFNLGEKLVLALCDEAEIRSTKGGVRFDADGRHAIKDKRAAGSDFRAVLHLTKPDYEETCRVITTLLPPLNVAVTTFNGIEIPHRDPLHVFKEQLPTEIADDEGNMRPSARQTNIAVFEPIAGETPMIYELGIPVVENNDRWHYDISQKVPLNMDRDNVKPAFLRQLRTLVLNEMHAQITQEDANATWTKEAIEDPRVLPEAVAAVITQRFGDKVVIFDPSDPEANRIATSEGYTVIAPRSFSKQAWQNIRQHELAQPAGRVTPSSTALLNDRLQADGTQDREVPEDKWTPAQHKVVAYAKEVGRCLIGFEPDISIVADVTLPAVAYYGQRRLTFNVGKLGHAWFNTPDQTEVDALLIHEFAHEKASNHLDHSFHDETCRLGALLRHVKVWL